MVGIKTHNNRTKQIDAFARVNQSSAYVMSAVVRETSPGTHQMKNNNAQAGEGGEEQRGMPFAGRKRKLSICHKFLSCCLLQVASVDCALRDTSVAVPGNRNLPRVQCSIRIQIMSFSTATDASGRRLATNFSKSSMEG